MNDVIRTSKPSNAVLAGNAFVARFKREPVSPSDAAWLNGFVIALESNTSETECVGCGGLGSDARPFQLACKVGHIGPFKDERGYYEKRRLPPAQKAVERPWPWPMCKGCGNEPSACTCEQEGRHETYR